MEPEIKDKLIFNIPAVEERNIRENELRKLRQHKRLSFGINYLDKALSGISRNDLILLGGASGTGKTEAAIHIAAWNVAKGKRVLFFALEAEECEIESRIKYKIAARKYYNEPLGDSKLVLNFTYRNWYNNALGKNAEKYENFANERYAKEMGNLHTVYREKEFSIDDFQRYLLSCYNKYDLIIVDHLNYFDLDDNKTEIRAVTDTIKRIRDMSLLCGIPILLLAHLRKTDRKLKQLIPDIDDFYGTSNIAKICTKAIIIAPDMSEPNVKDPNDRFKYKTFFRTPKYRVDGSVNRYISRCSFDVRTNRYDNEFELGRLDFDGKEFKPIEEINMIPPWAKDGYENRG